MNANTVISILEKLVKERKKEVKESVAQNKRLRAMIRRSTKQLKLSGVKR